MVHEEDTPLSTDDLFRILANPQRRRILLHLATGVENRRSIKELVAYLHSETSNSEPSRRRIRQQLHHVHLPKLAEFGLVTYSMESNDVLYEEHERLEAFLAHLTSLTDASDGSSEEGT